MMSLITLKCKTCDKVVRDDAFSLICVSDWFVMQEQIKTWHDNDDWYDADEIIE